MSDTIDLTIERRTAVLISDALAAERGAFVFSNTLTPAESAALKAFQKMLRESLQRAT